MRLTRQNVTRASRIMLPTYAGFFAVLGANYLTTTLYRYALLLCALSMTVWTLVGIAAIFASRASPGVWAWPALVVAACAASYQSLTHEEAD